ncbi:hypothetical protein MACJ_000013 [Theileria orientalis]|uniref:Uncharacterized protein n=1 Tax=Theileria orientalis TaxID=68886 RepID=A0A976QPK3_THEOR|nr:hypothetical protein MACJ_000013 [Theileria orientalis]
MALSVRSIVQWVMNRLEDSVNPSNPVYRVDLLNELVGNLNNIKSVLLQLSSNDIRKYQYLLLLRGYNVNSGARKDRLEELCTQHRNYMLNQLVLNKVGSRRYKKKS